MQTVVKPLDELGGDRWDAQFHLPVVIETPDYPPVSEILDELEQMERDILAGIWELRRMTQEFGI